MSIWRAIEPKSNSNVGINIFCICCTACHFQNFLKVQYPPSNAILRMASPLLLSESESMPRLRYSSHYIDLPSKGVSTVENGDGDQKRLGFVQYVFVLTFVLFLKSTELRSIRGWRRCIVQRAQPPTRRERWDLRLYFLVFLLYNDFAVWTQLLFFVKSAIASRQREKAKKMPYMLCLCQVQRPKLDNL